MFQFRGCVGCRLVALGLLVGFAVSACGGGSDFRDARLGGDTIPPISEPDQIDGDLSPTEPAPGVEITEEAVVSVDETARPGEVRALVRAIDISETVHYAGFDVTVHDVAIGFDPAGFRVAVVNVTLANQTIRADSLQTVVEISSQGFVAVVDRDEAPQVRSGESDDGYFSLRLDSGFSFDDAILFIGRPDRQRVQIPLGSTGELVTRAPVVIAEGGVGSDRESFLSVDSVTLAWDIANPRGQVEPGQVYLDVVYTIETTESEASGGGPVTMELPNGSVADPASVRDAGVEVAAMSRVASFLVDEPVAGDYVLQVFERFGRGEAEAGFSLS